MTHISEITLLIAVIALALWPVVLFALRFLRERQKRLEYIERMTKDEQDEVTNKRPRHQRTEENRLPA